TRSTGSNGVHLDGADAPDPARAGRPRDASCAPPPDAGHARGALGAAVDARPGDARLSLGPFQTFGFTGPRQEPYAHAALTAPRPQPLRRTLLPGRGRERQAVQVDAERRLAQLRLVAAPDARRELQHERPAAADPDLRRGRPLADSERLGRAAGQLGGRARVLALPDVGKPRAIGDDQGVEDPVAREGGHGDDRLLGKLLDKAEPDPRGPQCRPHGAPQLPRRANERAGAAPLTVWRAHEARDADRLVGSGDDLPARLRYPGLGQPLALPELRGREHRGLG